MRLLLSAQEKEAILSIIRIWQRNQINIDTFMAIQSRYGVPARLIETNFWHLDTLDVLKEFEGLVFKGGTCIQSYIAPQMQRVSVDLDFNTTIHNPNAVLDAMEKINSKIIENGRAVSIKGINFGTIDFADKDRRTGTITFLRRMPSRFGEIEKVGDADIQSKSVRIQINYKHAWLPAIRTEHKTVNFFVQKEQKPAYELRFIHASIEDLFADKILAVSNIGPFGRERFKDIYDLIILSFLDMKKDLILKKLKIIGEKSNLTADAIIGSAVETILNLSEGIIEARGFASMVCRDGKRIVDRWEDECRKLVKCIVEFREFTKS